MVHDVEGDVAPDQPDLGDGGSVYAVGYGKPPLHSRFKPGQSGNPKGKVKARRSLKAILEAALYEKVSIQTPRGVRKISKIDALLRRAVNDALKGDRKALQQVFRLAKEAGLTEEIEAIEAEMSDLDAADQQIHDRYYRSPQDMSCAESDDS